MRGSELGCPKEQVSDSLTNREKKKLAYAARVALGGECRQKHAAIVVKGGRIVGIGKNSYRNNPARFGDSDYIPTRDIAIHAEEAAIKNAGVNAAGAKIYVARVMKDGTLGLSRPCDRCYQGIVKAKIKSIIHS